MELSALLSLALLLAAAPDPAPPGNVTFSCSDQVETCYFTVYFAAGGHKSFTVVRGKKESISGISVDDTYCESDTTIPDDNTCEQKPVPSG